MSNETYQALKEAEITQIAADPISAELQRGLFSFIVLKPDKHHTLPSPSIETFGWSSVAEGSPPSPPSQEPTLARFLASEKRPFEDTIQFLLESLEGNSAIALERLPQKTQGMLKRGLFILQQYYCNGRDGHEIAEDMNITPSIVYQIKNRTIRKLWKHSDPSVKEKYPIDALRLEKPRTVERDMNISRGKGGRATRIAKLAQQGLTSAEICSQLDINTETLNKYRHILRRWGINMPYKIGGYEVKKRIQDTIDEGRLTDLTAEGLLNTVSFSLYENNNSGDNPLFTPIKKVANKAGFRYSGNIAYKFYDELERAGIPLGKVTKEVKSGNQKPQTYVFIFTCHLDRAIKTLEAFPDLDRYRVQTPTEKSA